MIQKLTISFALQTSQKIGLTTIYDRIDFLVEFVKSAQAPAISSNVTKYLWPKWDSIGITIGWKKWRSEYYSSKITCQI